MVTWKMIANEYKVALRHDENVIKLDYDDSYTAVNILIIIEFYTLNR